MKGKYDRKPVAGKDLTLAIDEKLQALGERLMTEMNPNGGRKVHFLAKRRMEAELPIEKVGAELRSMMSWLKK